MVWYIQIYIRIQFSDCTMKQCVCVFFATWTENANALIHFKCIAVINFESFGITLKRFECFTMAHTHICVVENRRAEIIKSNPFDNVILWCHCNYNRQRYWVDLQKNMSNIIRLWPIFALIDYQLQKRSIFDIRINIIENDDGCLFLTWYFMRFCLEIIRCELNKLRCEYFKQNSKNKLLHKSTYDMWHN